HDLFAEHAGAVDGGRQRVGIAHHEHADRSVELQRCERHQDRCSRLRKDVDEPFPAGVEFEPFDHDGLAARSLHASTWSGSTLSSTLPSHASAASLMPPTGSMSTRQHFGAPSNTLSTASRTRVWNTRCAALVVMRLEGSNSAAVSGADWGVSWRSTPQWTQPQSVKSASPSFATRRAMRALVELSRMSSATMA